MAMILNKYINNTNYSPVQRFKTNRIIICFIIKKKKKYKK